MIFIYITCKNKKEAKKIAFVLIKKRLAACCNIFPIESIYWSRRESSPRSGSSRLWQNKIIKDREVVLIVKTLKKNFKKIEKEVKKLHSYEIPCIVSLNIEKVHSEFLKWLKKEIK